MAMQTPSRSATEAARNQFASSLRMLRTLAEVCPREVWESRVFGLSFPVWYQVYHAAYFVDYWLQDGYEGERSFCMAFDNRIPPEFEHDVDSALIISKEEMISYLALLETKTDRFFDRLNDGLLGSQIARDAKSQTYADVVFGQNRHIMYNVGYVNAVLRSLNLEESDWYAYNEDDE